MLDTVRIYTQDFELREKNKFVTRYEVNSEGELLGEKRYCNLGYLSLDVTPDRRLFLTTSLPKLLYKTSLFEVKPEDLGRAVETLEKRVSEAGVEIAKSSLADFSLSRVDFCRNIQVDHHPVEYLVTLSDFCMSRRNKRDIDHETLSFRNSDHELTFYNKVREVRENEKDVEIQKLLIGRVENILRVESRIKKHRAIARVLKSKSLSLRSVFDFEVCREKLLRDFDCLVFSANKQTELHFEENLELLDRIERERKRGAFKEFLAIKGVKSFFEEFRGDWEKIRELLEAKYRKRQVYHHLSELRKYKSLVLKEEDRDLIGEIREKIRLAA